MKPEIAICIITYQRLEKLKLCIESIVKQKTKFKYDRVNPLLEDITDWKKKGEYLFGVKNITIYDSSTIAGERCQRMVLGAYQ